MTSKLNDNLTLTIIFPYKIGKKTFLSTEKRNFYKDQTLSKGLKNFFLSKSESSFKGEYFCYLSKNGKAIKKLAKEKPISQLKLNELDKIIISYKELKTEETEEEPQINKINIINERRETNEVIKVTEIKSDLIKVEENEAESRTEGSARRIIFNVNQKPNSQIKRRNISNNRNILRNMIILGIITVLFIIGIYFKVIKKKKNQEEKNEIIYSNEDLIIKKNYPINRLFRYSSNQTSAIILEGEEIPKNNKTFETLFLMDFIFIVREQNIEINETEKSKKEWYTGYIGFLNVTIINKTHNMLSIYDKSLNNYLDKKNLRRLENLNKINGKVDVDYVNDENNICFSKIDFYQNGKIKKYYLPKDFSIDNFNYIQQISQLLIPKISTHLFNKTINQTLNELLEKDNREYNDNADFNDDNYNINYNDIRENNNYRLLSSENISIPIKKVKRKLSENTKNYYEEPENVIIEEYITKPLSKSDNIECHEKNEINNNNNKTNNYSILTEFSIKPIENEEAKLEGGSTNNTIYSIIDSEGNLESVIKETILVILDNQGESNSEEEDEETQSVNQEIYNENNEINLNDLKSMNTTNYNNISFGITNFTQYEKNIINCTDNFTNKEINNLLYKYFDSFDYIEYNIIESNNDKSEPKINLRQLSEESTYYGFKNFVFLKPLYKHNLLGLKMETQIISEITPSKGTMSSYFDVIFGNMKQRIKLSDQHSNMNIVLEKKNQMGYNLLKLLYKSNLDLQERNTKYADIIIQLEQNMSQLFEEKYDYSFIFRDSMNDMYNQVQNFTGEFFYELIRLINEVYDNYTQILNNAELGKYEAINQIRKVTKDEYINYIYNMLEILENFENKTLIFLDEIKNEINNINNFLVDILYDIVDQIKLSKIIFKQFNKNLFKSIEKGILTFKYDVLDYIDLIIGDLLYITDFLSININKNEIIIKAIDLNTRNEVTPKLKNFRNMIIYLMDSIIININNDYEQNMDLNNINSIKYYSYQKAQFFMNDTEQNSDKVINDIKKLINNFEKYELYSKNLDIINSINNITIVEWINYISNNVINKARNLKPEFINETNNIIKNENTVIGLV